MPEMGADNGLQLADLTGKDYDDADWDKLLDQLSFEDMTTLMKLFNPAGPSQSDVAILPMI